MLENWIKELLKKIFTMEKLKLLVKDNWDKVNVLEKEKISLKSNLKLKWLKKTNLFKL